jgi:UDP-perosamine 4-acetyltransferase
MKESKEIYVLGIGHNSIVYIDMLEQIGYTIKGLYHYNSERTGEFYYGYQILGSFDDLYSIGDFSGMNFALSMGDNRIRKTVFEKIVSMGGSVPTLIHPKADVSKYAQLGVGVVIHSNAVVHPDVKIGNNSIVSYNCSLTHQSILGNHCYIAGHALIGAYTTIGNNVFVGLGAILISDKVKSIGDNAIIGAGAVVSSSVEANVVVAGVPARVIRTI